jgi:hypothetical protein
VPGGEHEQARGRSLPALRERAGLLASVPYDTLQAVRYSYRMNIEQIYEKHLESNREMLREAKLAPLDRLFVVLGGGGISFGTASGLMATAAGISPMVSVIAIGVGTGLTALGYICWKDRKELEREVRHREFEIKKLQMENEIRLEKMKV